MRRLHLYCYLLPILALGASWPASVRGEETYEALAARSVQTQVLRRLLYPFVATCDKEKDHFRQLFCTALNDRLKAQHQGKVYRSTFEPSEAGPLLVSFKAKPEPTMEVVVKGCLTCNEPMLESKGGDISKGRFFLFKLPKEIKIKRRGNLLYDLGDIDMASYQVKLPKEMTEKKFQEEVLPFVRLDLLFRPEAGVELVGAGRYKYGVITFELVGHRFYDRCAGTVFGGAPKAAGKFVVDKNDLSCPQNQPKKAVAKVVLPSTLPQVQVRTLMDHLSEDLQVCYEQFGLTGDVPADIVVTPKGQVKFVKVTGKLSGTPSGQCVERLIKNVEFPKFSGDDARLQWPLSLRN
jgi:hypothetical protein